MKPAMAIKRIDAMILYANDLERTVHFYRELGLPLEEEDHGSGPLHYALDLGGAHIAVFAGKPGQAPARGAAGGAVLGFQVDSLEESFARAKAAGASVILEPQKVSWGARCLIGDPDGRVVELNQA